MHPRVDVCFSEDVTYLGLVLFIAEVAHCNLGDLSINIFLVTLLRVCWDCTSVQQT